MSSDPMFLLSEVASSGEFEVVRDSSFQNLGFLSDPQPDMLAFAESRRFAVELARSGHVRCIITTPALASEVDSVEGLAVSSAPRWSFHLVHQYLARHTTFYWADFPTEIDASAHIHPRACIAERNVRIGPYVRVEANATVLERCTLEEGATVHAGAVFGSAGFQTMAGGNRLEDMTHAGGLIVGRHTRILANAVVATAVFRQQTLFGEQCRVGNCAFISHNVTAGSETTIGHGAVVNGNVGIGSRVWIGPGACVTNNVRIGDGAEVLLGAVVIGNVAPGERVAGNFAIGERRLLRHLASIR